MPFNQPERRRSVALVGLMGAGKTAVGRRLAEALGLPFHDADQEIERAAGLSVSEIFSTHGEPHFRAGEKRVVRRLLEAGPIVLATGGGAFMDAETRAAIARHAVAVWLRVPLPVILKRVRGRTSRPLLNAGDPEETLARLSAARSPFYAQADLVVDGADDPVGVTVAKVAAALDGLHPPIAVPVPLGERAYQVLVGPNLIVRAGALIAPLLPSRRVAVVTDETVAALHLPGLLAGLNEAGIRHDVITVPAGEASKTVSRWAMVVEALLAAQVDRATTVVALGGGVVGDLAGFAAAATLRGLNFVQIPTTLLAQVDSSVGGKTGINAPQGKNLIGAFHQPALVLADTAALATLPVRELRAGYAEIVKAGLIADAALYGWCEANGAALLAGDSALLAEAVAQAVAFKARVVGDDERETKPNDGRALLNLGHTFAHALEAEAGYGGGLLHGEAVGIGLVLAASLSERLGHAPDGTAQRIAAHLASAGLPVRVPNGMPAENLLAHMKQDKKMRDGRLAFVLLRGIGQAFTSRDVPEAAVRETLSNHGAA